VAGMADMDYRKFTRYNIVGGVAWIAVFLVAGNILGKFEFIRKNLEYAVPLIILVTLLPMYFEVRRHKKEAAKKRAQLAARTASAEASSE
jgi:membrane-associated protein